MKRVLLIDVSYAFKKKFNKYLSERGKMIKFDVVLSFPRFYFFGWDLTEYFERNYDLYLVSHLATTYNKNIIEDAKEYGCNLKQLGPSALTPMKLAIAVCSRLSRAMFRKHSGNQRIHNDITHSKTVIEVLSGFAFISSFFRNI